MYGWDGSPRSEGVLDGAKITRTVGGWGAGAGKAPGKVGYILGMPGSQESWSSQKRMAFIGYNWKVFQGSPGELDGATGGKGIISTRPQASRGDTACWRVEGILQTVLNCVRLRRGWRPQSKVHWVCQAQVRALWPFVPFLDAEELPLFGVPTFRAPGLILCVVGTPKPFCFLSDHASRVREWRAWRMLAPPGY